MPQRWGSFFHSVWNLLAPVLCDHLLHSLDVSILSIVCVVTFEVVFRECNVYCYTLFRAQVFIITSLFRSGSRFSSKSTQ